MADSTRGAVDDYPQTPNLATDSPRMTLTGTTAAPRVGAIEATALDRWWVCSGWGNHPRPVSTESSFNITTDRAPCPDRRSGVKGPDLPVSLLWREAFGVPRYPVKDPS